MQHLRTLGWLLLGLVAATGSSAQSAAPEIAPAEFQNCLDNLQSNPVFKRISAQTWQQYVAPLQADASVLPLLDKQPEFTMPVWDYMAVLVDAERVADGRAAVAQWQDTLVRVAQRYGVAAPVVAGVWGVESNFGKNLGSKPLLSSLGTLSCFGRRQTYFRTEFASALQIVQSGDVAADKLNGSWAGAFGQTQFMPSTFLRLAQDFDGDGQRDIVDSVPDALASTANFLAKAGYKTAEPWGFEVRLPHTDFRSARKDKMPLAAWRAQGLLLANGRALPDSMSSAGLLLPSGPQGPAFLVGKNFETLYSYNASENYALAIAHLSDLIANPSATPGFVTPWPTDDAGLSRAENRQLQTLLLQRGHDIGTADGLIGAKTRTAIKIEQERAGWTPDGRAGQKLLRALQK